MALNSPTKASKKAPVDLIDDSRRSQSPASISEEDELDVLRRQFVGDINLPEGVLSCLLSGPRY
jgi:ribonucleoside-diphosphate reductase subunit M2